jgi:hypothetical protein
MTKVYSTDAVYVLDDFQARTGIASVFAQVGGILYSAEGALGNAAGGGVTVLHNYTVPANTLIVAGQSIWFLFTGTFANNANVHTLSLAWGADTLTLFSSTGVASDRWYAEGRLMRRSNTVQVLDIYFCRFGTITRPGAAATFTRTLSSANVLSVRGASAGASDIVNDSIIVGWDNAGL